MTTESRLENALNEFDAANRQDPQSRHFEGATVPRELAFSLCVEKWVTRLVEQPSEALRLAARGHTLRRWEIARESYPMTRPGYRLWRTACARHHADSAETVMNECGYDPTTIGKVRDLILKTNWPDDSDASALEDADCLAFLELKLHEYVDEWDEPKMQRILQKTLKKMTPQARQLTAGLKLGTREKAILQKAVTEAFGA